MKRHVLFLLIMASLSAVPTTYAIADESLYVQPFRAKIFSKASMSSEVIGSVDSGYQLVSTGREGSWVKFAYKGKQGFLPAVQVAKTPPLGKSAVQGAEAAPKLNVRARTSSSSAVVAGMKGLTYENRARVTQGERTDFESLDKVDAIRISADELMQFQLEGGKR